MRRFGLRMFERYRDDGLHGVRFALNVFVGATALRLILRHVAGVNPLWTIAAMITAGGPVLTDARKDARASSAVLFSSYFVRLPGNWRQAPHTAAIVIGSGFLQHSKAIEVEEGASRVGEVSLGGAMRLVVSSLMSSVWPLPERGGAKASSG